jgi:hypothetical protein
MAQMEFFFILYFIFIFFNIFLFCINSRVDDFKHLLKILILKNQIIIIKCQ